MNKKKKIRAAFRAAVFGRDGYRCRVCGKSADPESADLILDAHHITSRKEMPNGGYVKENGITLCKGDDGTSCHERAEAGVLSATDLYELIGSSREKAEAASR